MFLIFFCFDLFFFLFFIFGHFLVIFVSRFFLVSF